jgi:hypothetical protein
MRDKCLLASPGGQCVALPRRRMEAVRTAFVEVKTRRVIRGGSFGGVPVNLWIEYRDSHPPDGAREFVGFRCAKSLPDQIFGRSGVNTLTLRLRVKWRLMRWSAAE